MFTGLVGDPGNHHDLVGAGIGQLGKRHHVVGAGVVGDVLAVVESTVLKPDLAGGLGTFSILFDLVAGNGQNESVDVFANGLI
jgi:hypothetical protein